MATMTEKVDRILMIVSRVEPMVQEHHSTLYGNDGLKQNMALTMQRQADCPARKAATVEGKRLRLAHVAMVVAIISCIVSTVVAVSKLAGP